jgi:hypothetical protein
MWPAAWIPATVCLAKPLNVAEKIFHCGLTGIENWGGICAKSPRRGEKTRALFADAKNIQAVV